jgi:AbrB family looped-hinge helix DNA binding protein
LKPSFQGNTLWIEIITEDDMTTTVTTKGQVTIPKPVRDFLGIVPGSKVDFHRATDGSVVMTRADRKQPPSRFDKLRGHAGDGLDTDAIMALTRGET